MGEARDFAARRIAMDDAMARRADEGGLGFGHGGERAGAIARRDRLLDLTDGTAYARAPRFVYDSTARDLASGLLGGLCISHDVSDTNCSE